MFVSKYIKRLFLNNLKQSFLLPLFFYSLFSFGQNFDSVDATARQFSSDINSAQELASIISKNYATDIDKVRALYIYLTNNIAYDLNDYKYGANNYSFSYSSKKELEEKIRKRDLEVIQRTLSSKKAICEGYSMVYKEVCDILNIKCEIISGYSRTVSSTIGVFPIEERHAWNAVYINSQWNLIDTTWGAGYSKDANHWIQSFDANYFFTKPEVLIASHYPEDKNWQLLNTPLSKTQFCTQPIFSSLFFQEKIELISPKSGILRGNNKYLIVQLKNVKPDIEFGYAFEKDFYLTSIIPEFKNKKTILKIPITGKRNTTLNILSGTEMILQYKIE